MDTNSNWSYSEYDVLYKEYPINGPVAVSDKIGRTVTSTVGRASKMGLNVPTPFTPQELQLARVYRAQLGDALIFLMPNRTTVEIEALLRCVNPL